MGELKTYYKWFVCVNSGKPNYDYEFDIVTEEILFKGDSFQLDGKVYTVLDADETNHTLEVNGVSENLKQVFKIIS